MVNSIDKLVTGNAAEQASSGRRPNLLGESTAGFRAVLQDVAAEPSADTNASDSATPESRTDARDGNSLPSRDQNLPTNPSEGWPFNEQVDGVGNAGGETHQASAASLSDSESPAALAALFDVENSQQNIGGDAADNALVTVQSRLYTGDTGQHPASDRLNLATPPLMRIDPKASHQSTENHHLSAPAGLSELIGRPSSQPLPTPNASVGILELSRESSTQPDPLVSTAARQPHLSGELGELVKLIEGERSSSLLANIERQSGTANALPMNRSGASSQPPATSLLGQASGSLEVKSPVLGTTDPMAGAKAIEHASLEKLVFNTGGDTDAALELSQSSLSRAHRPASGVEVTPPSNGSAAGALMSIGSVSVSNSIVSADGVVRSTPVLATADSESLSASMATHLRVMKSGGASEARLHLNPAELGRLSIQITSQDSEVKVSFVVESQQAKQVIENAMPRLRDLLDSAGLDLTESGVDQRDKHADDRNAQRGLKAADSDSFSDDSAQIAMTVTIDPNRLVDAYA